MNDKIAIIDTNIFYYISGITKYKNAPNIVPFIESNYKALWVSDLTLLELIVKNRNNKNVIMDAMNYLSNEKMSGHRFFPEDKSFLKYFNHSFVNNKKNYDKLINTTFNLKLDIERDFLLFWFGFTITAFIAVIYDKNNFDIYKATLLQKQLLALILSMKEKNEYVSGEITKYLMDFYNSGKESEFKQNVNYLLLNALFVATSMLESSSQDKLIFSEATSIFEQYLKTTKNKSKKGIKLLEKEIIPKLEDTLEQFVDKLRPITGYPLAKFYTILVKKFLSLENKLFNKNDIMDGLFLHYMREYQILTLDKNFISNIKEIDQAQYDNIMLFKNSIDSNP